LKQRVALDFGFSTNSASFLFEKLQQLDRLLQAAASITRDWPWRNVEWTVSFLAPRPQNQAAKLFTQIEPCPQRLQFFSHLPVCLSKRTSPSYMT